MFGPVRIMIWHASGSRPTLVGHLGEGDQDVQQGDGAAGSQKLLRLGGDLCPHLGEEVELEAENPLLGSEHAALVLLQLRGHVALGAHEGLPAQIVRRHLGGMRIAHLDGVPEDPVEPHAQAPDPGPLPLALLERRDPLAGLARRLLELPQLGVPALPDETALAELERRGHLQRFLQQLLQSRRRDQILRHGSAERRVEGRQLLAERGKMAERCAEADQVPGMRDTERGAAREPLEVADAVEALPERGPDGRRLGERADRVVAPPDLRQVEQRAQEPLAEQTRAHRRLRPVERADERATARALVRRL
jgi:hypothetical protein